MTVVHSRDAVRPCKALGVSGTGSDERVLQGPQIGPYGLLDPFQSVHDGLRVRHSFGCALVCRGGSCDCGADNERKP